MNMFTKALACLVASLALAGCAGTWSTSDVTPTAAGKAAPTAARPASEIIITENDITDRTYTVLGDISVGVRKTTIFDKDPTREQAAQKLREEAVKLGADAVVLVRYGSVGVSAWSWGALDAKGRAVKFN
jgi:uncharacterized protein YbjQ (UPF0145 family)